MKSLVLIFLVMVYFDSSKVFCQSENQFTRNPAWIPMLNRNFGIIDDGLRTFRNFKKIYIGYKEEWNSTNVHTEVKKFQLLGNIETTNGITYKFSSATLERQKDFFDKLTIVTDCFDGKKFELTGTFYHEKPLRDGNFVAFKGEITFLEDDNILEKGAFEFADTTSEDISEIYNESQISKSNKTSTPCELP